MKVSSLFSWFLLVHAPLVTTPAHSETAVIVKKVGAHTYAFPRDILEMIYRPDYSRIPNANPNWSRDPVVRLKVQWPDFGPAPDSKDFEVLRRGINITLLTIKDAPLTSVEQTIQNLEARELHPRTAPANYGLQEFRSDLTKDFREFIGRMDNGVKVRIYCNAENDTRPYHCDVKYPVDDLNVDVYFGSVVLPQWKELLDKTTALIQKMRRDE